MRLVLFAHPAYLGFRSQGLFAAMLAEACRKRGHEVQVRSSGDTVQRRLRHTRLAKWAGYFDQFVLFPPRMRREIRQDPADTLYVFCDQALGPWVPHAAHRPHVVHCADFLALRTALGEWPEQRLSWSGQLYQRWIRTGFRQARHFISISGKTRDDLHRVGQVQALTSEVVHLGLNHAYAPMAPDEARRVLSAGGIAVPLEPFLLHIGGGQWYKNLHGVLALYERYALAAQRDHQSVAPLVLVGPPPHGPAALVAQGLEPPARLVRLSGLSARQLQALYSLAQAFLFPSLAEGFGWPVAEAMACACPVVTTGEPPMSEVGADAAVYLPRLRGTGDLEQWAESGARVLLRLQTESPAERQRRQQAGLARAAQFRTEDAIDRYIALYEQVLLAEMNPRTSHARAF